MGQLEITEKFRKEKERLKEELLKKERENDLEQEKLTVHRKNLESEKSQLEMDIARIESTLEALLKKDPKEEVPVRVLPIPECPVCLEQMMPPTRIMQCPSGHLVYQTCESQPELRKCPTCRQDFTGRATA